MGQKYEWKDIKAFRGYLYPVSVGGIYRTGYVPLEGCYIIFANFGTAN